MSTLDQIKTFAQVLDPRTDQCPVLVRRASWNNVEEQFPITRELNASSLLHNKIVLSSMYESPLSEIIIVRTEHPFLSNTEPIIRDDEEYDWE